MKCEAYSLQTPIFAEPVQKAEFKVLQQVGGESLMATAGRWFVETFLLLFDHCACQQIHVSINGDRGIKIKISVGDD